MMMQSADDLLDISEDKVTHLRNTLQIIADFPIADQRNQDAHNMALIASQALRATTPVSE